MEEVKIGPEIISIKQMVSTPNLSIPHYQRPYKWLAKNVNQLIDDVLLFQKKPKYRLGTIVYHLDEEKKLNIVDGQQRSITVLLICLAIKNNKSLQEKLQNANIKLPEIKAFTNLEFENTLSKNNIRDNYKTIQRRVQDFTEETVVFFLDNCEFVKVVLTDISEAFQFFDSQNTRGADLEPHDLLKAFHLREMMNNTTEKQRVAIVESWENMGTNQLRETFGNYLFRVKNWSNGKHARKFTKNDIDIFKGISPYDKNTFPYADIYKIGHFYIDKYNTDQDRYIDNQVLDFPFQLDQVVLNGRRFFQMIAHYVVVIQHLKQNIQKESQASKILDKIYDYDGAYRTGDNYVRNMFYCALLYYTDKFGYVSIERAIEKIFVWAYTLRLTYQNVQLASMDNYALGYPYVFKTIKNALKPNDFLNLQLPILLRRGNKGDYVIRSSKTNKIEELFITLNAVYES